MTLYYWDTSALVKQFIQEVGTGEALALRADAPPHATATIDYTETFRLEEFSLRLLRALKGSLACRRWPDQLRLTA